MPGGVSDYCARVAEGLARASAQVHVWSPAVEATAPPIDGVSMHPVRSWGRGDLARLGASLDSFTAPRRLIVQYVPSAWGHRGLNLGLCHWLRERRRRGDDISLMVHEPFYPWRLFDKPARWFLAAGQRIMAERALSASARVYVAIPAWERCLRPYARRRAMTWLPVPSNIPVIRDEARAAALRARLARGGKVVVGTFGTYGAPLAATLQTVLPRILRNRPERVLLLLGRGGERAASDLVTRHPSLGGRVHAPGALDPASLSLHLQACTILLQPYPDGVSSRRGTIMAPLAHGAAIVTNEGALTERLWSETGCVALASGPEPAEIVDVSESLLGDPPAQARLRSTARRVYTAHFSVEHTVRKLLSS